MVSLTNRQGSPYPDYETMDTTSDKGLDGFRLDDDELNPNKVNGITEVSHHDNYNDKLTWIVDTGCGRNLTNDKSLLTRLRKSSKEINTFVYANGTSSSSSHIIGTAILNITNAKRNDQRRLDLPIRDCYFKEIHKERQS